MRKSCSFDHAIAMDYVWCTLHFGKLAALGPAHCIILNTIEWLNIIFRERCSDGAQNQILLCTEIARELGLERSTNAARREFLACADRGVDELSDGGLERVVQNHTVP